MPSLLVFEISVWSQLPSHQPQCTHCRTCSLKHLRLTLTLAHRLLHTALTPSPCPPHPCSPCPCQWRCPRPSPFASLTPPILPSPHHLPPTALTHTALPPTPLTPTALPHTALTHTALTHTALTHTALTHTAPT